MSVTRLCSVSACRKKLFARSLCSMHYHRDKRGTDLSQPHGAIRREDISRLIDSLVMGRPIPEVLNRRLSEMAEQGWTAGELGVMYGMSRDAVQKRISRHQQSAQK